MLFLVGSVLCRLMRQSHCTIRTLAQRMQVPLCRIRQVRQHGLTCPYAARDWVQAITGADPGPITGPLTLEERTMDAQDDGGPACPEVHRPQR